MFEDYQNALFYCFFGLVGAILHYLKKFYVDETLSCDLTDYITGHLPRTIYSVISIFVSEAVLLTNHQGDVLALTNVLGALSVGYMFDSAVNKSPDQVK